MKPPVSLRDCIALGNKRNFRIWRRGELDNCLGAYSRDASLWVKEEGRATGMYCTFHDDGKTAVRAEPTSEVTLTRCLVSMTGDLKGRQPLTGQVNSQESEICTPGGGKKDPDFQAPRQDWDGSGGAMDSRSYSERGYGSSRIRPATGK